MQFLNAIQLLSLFAAGTLATPADFESRNLEARVDCSRILPACNGGHVTGQTDCRCKGQRGRCDVWQCPGSGPNVVRRPLPCVSPLIGPAPATSHNALTMFEL